jgi:hypothetical protein
VPLRVHQAVIDNPLERGHVDPPTVGGPGRTSCVIEEDYEHIRRTCGRFLREKCGLVRFGIADVKIYRSFEGLHRLSPKSFIAQIARHATQASSIDRPRTARGFDALGQQKI